jgi:hypothetical protein
MKYHFPDLDYNQIIDELQNLVEQGHTLSMRFLAFFTRHYLEESDNLSWLLQGNHEFALDAENFFKIVQK